MGGVISGQNGNHSELDQKRNEVFRVEEQEIMERSSVDVYHKSRKESTSSLDDTDRADSAQACLDANIDPRQFLFPFENLIFEGGGNKGLAYCGAIKCLEDMNLRPQVQRVAGSSAGAITAALLALGYNSSDIELFMTENVEYIFLDHSYGYLSLIPNLLSGWGWNPGRRIYNWLGEKIKAKTGNPDLTFYELYKNSGIELCVVVTNLNQMRAEYCHPKTTPNMIIRQALRMSMSIPVVFMACPHDNNGQTDTYVDGGVLCNYPIQCFDGWYLSMDKKDSFLLHMQKLDDLSHLFSVKSMFGSSEELNMKTLGFLLYDDTEVEVMKNTLEKRNGVTVPDKPSKETKLYKKKMAAKNIQMNLKEERRKCQTAAEAFMKALLKHNIDDDMVIDKEELKKALEDESCFSAKQREKLFGKDVTVDEAFQHLDKDGNGQIDIQELFRFLEKKNIRIQTRIQGYGRTEIENLLDFASALQNSWTTNLKYVYVGDNDVKRTVGINTGHIGTSNYVLEKEDREFLIARGYNATLAFLKYFKALNPDKVTARQQHEETES